MPGSTHYFPQGVLTVLFILIASSLAALLFVFASDFWKPIVIIISTGLLAGTLTFLTIKRLKLQKQSIVKLKTTTRNRFQRALILIAAICMAIAGVIWVIQAFRTVPIDLWLLAQASLDLTAVVGWTIALLPGIQQVQMTPTAFFPSAAIQPIRWVQIDKYDWEEKEFKGKKHLLLHLYARNSLKVPLFQHIKVKIVIHPEEKVPVETLLRQYLTK